MPPSLRSRGAHATPLSLSGQAYHEIRSRILRGELALGAPLSRRKLAVELGMSLLPVSEALQALERDGLIESRPRVGTRVCFPTAEEIRDRYEVREALEAQASRLYAERATATERREMSKMAAQLDALFQSCSASPDRDTLYATHSLHFEFHLRIAAAARCRTLTQMIEKNHVLIFNWLFDVAATRPSLPRRFHSKLLDALNRGDAEAADRAMRKHVRYGLEHVVKRLGSRAKDIPFERVK